VLYLWTQRFNSSAPSALPAPGDYDVVPKWPGQEPARLTLLERDVFIASAERFPAREIVRGGAANLEYHHTPTIHLPYSLLKIGHPLQPQGC
jgi:hypothetical protein